MYSSTHEEYNDGIRIEVYSGYEIVNVDEALVRRVASSSYKPRTVKLPEGTTLW